MRLIGTPERIRDSSESQQLAAQGVPAGRERWSIAALLRWLFNALVGPTSAACGEAAER
jgi:hypothetical protein